MPVMLMMIMMDSLTKMTTVNLPQTQVKPTVMVMGWVMPVKMTVMVTASAM
jgi:hypothetical protein